MDLTFQQHQRNRDIQYTGYLSYSEPENKSTPREGDSMYKLRILALAAAGLLVLSTAGTALGSSVGDANAGDVWLDNVGQPAGPGHEMDPHLACQDINLWGAKLADGSGTFTINGWPPSGAKEVDYSGTWSYDTSQGGSQVVATISVANLITTARSNGDSAAHNGFHFKLDFSQDPHKHKTFWVSCTNSSTFTTTSSSHRSTHRATHHPRTTSRSSHTRTTSTARHRRRRHRVSRRPRTSRGFTG
jgi:hypothetical protein